MRYSGTIAQQWAQAVKYGDDRVQEKLTRFIHLPADEFPCTYPDWLEKQMANWKSWHV